MKRHGFTLIELIIVVAIIALLAAATFVAINPAKRIGDAQNAQRWADVTAIADAFATYMADNSGSTPTSSYTGSGSLETNAFMVATTTVSEHAVNSSHCTATTTDEEFIALQALVTGGYIGQIPKDPTWTYGDHNDHTQYYLQYSSTGAITVGACETYNSAVIKVVR